MTEASEIPELTSNEEFDSFQPGDNTIEVTGAVVALDPPRRRANATPSRVKLLRCHLSNLTGRTLRLLFWDSMATTYEGQILKHYVRLTRVRVVPANPQYIDPNQQLMPIELSVQPTTRVEILGPMLAEVSNTVSQYRPVEIAQTSVEQGFVVVTGFIKVSIEGQVFGNASYGSGAITDGHYRLCVYVSSFDKHNSPPLGSHVRIKGELRKNNYGSVVLQAQDMSSIEIIDEVIMTKEELRKGFRVPLDKPTTGDEGNPQVNQRHSRGNQKNPQDNTRPSQGDIVSVPGTQIIRARTNDVPAAGDAPNDTHSHGPEKHSSLSPVIPHVHHDSPSTSVARTASEIVMSHNSAVGTRDDAEFPPFLGYTPSSSNNDSVDGKTSNISTNGSAKKRVRKNYNEDMSVGRKKKNSETNSIVIEDSSSEETDD